MSDREYSRQKRIIEKWDRLLGKWSIRIGGMFLGMVIIYKLFIEGR